MRKGVFLPVAAPNVLALPCKRDLPLPRLASNVGGAHETVDNNSDELRVRARERIGMSAFGATGARQSVLQTGYG